MPPIVFVYAYGVAWVAEHIVEIAIVSAMSGVLAVAAVVALMRWCDCWQARRAAGRPIWTVRAEPAIMAATVTPQVTRGTSAPAIEQHIHFHFDPDDREAARIIRQAIPGPAGDAATREE